ncbi:MAG: hypothetical protein ACW99G_02705 [Candidatus Thorarchaeota archaeon]|jgi:membrane protein implicated in regulation of membrane protease activity
MTYVIIGIVAAFVILSVFLIYSTYYWYNKYLNTGISVELELATQEQIIDELRSRPNIGFLLLEPVEDGEGEIIVTTHSWNLEPAIILASLKAAHDGMVEHLGVEIEEDEE